jgi:hypothetical protein
MSATDSTTRSNGAAPTTADVVDRGAPLSDAPVSTPVSDNAPRHVTITQDDTSHGTTTLAGHRVSYESTDEQSTTVSGNWREEEDARVREMIDNVVSERERRENIRANHRNLNRMLTLFGALIIGVIVTFVLHAGWLGNTGVVLAPYAFSITILMDSGLALYGYIRHY